MAGGSSLPPKVPVTARKILSSIRSTVRSGRFVADVICNALQSGGCNLRNLQRWTA
ncbi:hypothetical protein RGR602_PC00881 (plasmid) [Rhizobium gallicum bv. gallicum R602sp]|uniref:Uncharacterized protein n=1 Tax=Rhizobium gallicum bv. gallicum R602sp TaxID=1041138 RepID=A0A0B4XDS7_9HYPH|nr:hypothetical protein RGR602_PC00881 [Rhizobium gallicum bv. gallicum R602sp]